MEIMRTCTSCQVEAHPGSGVCHQCGRPLPETVEAAAAIKPAPLPRSAGTNGGAPNPSATTLPGGITLPSVPRPPAATTLPASPALQVSTRGPRTEPSASSAPTVERPAPQREAVAPARPSRRRGNLLILAALGLVLLLAGAASLV